MPIPTPHITAKEGDFAKTVLMPGDPKRAKFIAETFLEDAVLVNDVRGVQGYTGCYKGKRVSVMEIDSIDKSGIFRTLTLFKENHLLHQIDDGCEGVRYELCHAHGEVDDDRHVHFHCEVCHRTFCLEDTPIPAVTYPNGFQVESVNYMAKGICPKCAKKRK